MNPLKNVGLEVLLKLSIVNVTVSPFLTEIGYKLMIDLSLPQHLKLKITIRNTIINLDIIIKTLF